MPELGFAVAVALVCAYAAGVLTVTLLERRRRRPPGGGAE